MTSNPEEYKFQVEFVDDIDGLRFIGVKLYKLERGRLANRVNGNNLQ